MKFRIKTTMAILLLLVPISLSFGEQNEGSLQIDIKSWGGELADYHGIVLKIYPDFSQTPTVVPLPSNPYTMSLPLDHRYKIEVYVSSMYANVDYVRLVPDNPKVEISVPIPGSVRFTVVNTDGNTPIEGASVSVQSDDGTYRYWTNSTTDENGNTIRFWLQPTLLETDYYIAGVSVGDGLSTTFSPITIDPGKSQDIKITTPWPKIIDHAIVVSVYKSPTEKISGLGHNFAVELYDNDQHKLASSDVSDKGTAYFSNLEVGNYVFRVVDLDQPQNKEWGSVSVTLTGKQDSIRILTNSYESQNVNTNQTVFNNYIDDVQTTPPQIITKEPADKPQENSAIPSWIKNMAGWWSDDKISDSEFLKAIEYLVQHNIIDIQDVHFN
ncbi:MAG: carboxypeptidase regulatory-like domain-containing protein [Candidatus Nitrosotenuis sp.]|nr:MAG: carboxypeptidase regulatory-like domain-containing protein [Candidatus Nitrosotenuis sp.]